MSFLYNYIQSNIHKQNAKKLEEKRQNIPDETEKNIEIPINQGNGTNVSETPEVQNAFDQAQKLQKEQWAREDAIRKEVQQREDNAYRRATSDMQKAGINPNLVNVQPAQSGGGIAQSTGINYSMLTEEQKIKLETLLQEREHEFKDYQGIWDRVVKLVGDVLNVIPFT